MMKISSKVKFIICLLAFICVLSFTIDLLIFIAQFILFTPAPITTSIIQQQPKPKVLNPQQQPPSKEQQYQYQQYQEQDNNGAIFSMGTYLTIKLLIALIIFHYIFDGFFQLWRFYLYAKNDYNKAHTLPGSNNIKYKTNNQNQQNNNNNVNDNDINSSVQNSNQNNNMVKSRNTSNNTRMHSSGSRYHHSYSIVDINKFETQKKNKYLRKKSTLNFNHIQSYNDDQQIYSDKYNNYKYNKNNKNNNMSNKTFLQTITEQKRKQSYQINNYFIKQIRQLSKTVDQFNWQLKQTKMFLGKLLEKKFKYYSFNKNKLKEKVMLMFEVRVVDWEESVGEGKSNKYGNNSINASKNDNNNNTQQTTTISKLINLYQNKQLPYTYKHVLSKNNKLQTATSTSLLNIQTLLASKQQRITQQYQQLYQLLIKQIQLDKQINKNLQFNDTIQRNIVQNKLTLIIGKLVDDQDVFEIMNGHNDDTVNNLLQTVTQNKNVQNNGVINRFTNYYQLNEYLLQLFAKELNCYLPSYYNCQLHTTNQTIQKKSLKNLFQAKLIQSVYLLHYNLYQYEQKTQKTIEYHIKGGKDNVFGVLWMYLEFVRKRKFSENKVGLRQMLEEIKYQ